MDALFKGLGVVDAGTWIAGPVSSTILADHGTDVTKVEMPGDGDAYRRLAHAPGTPSADIVGLDKAVDLPRTPTC